MEDKTKDDIALAKELLKSKGYSINEFTRNIYANGELAANHVKRLHPTCSFGMERFETPDGCIIPKHSRVYISGPIAHYDLDERMAAFKNVEYELADDNLFPVNPFNNGLPQPGDWRDHMRVDILLLLSCDYIIFLPHWYESKGCRLELYIAASTGIKVYKFIRE